MSATPKRLHEEGSHSTPLKRPIEEIGVFYNSGKLIHPAGNDFRATFEPGPDARLSKIQRTEPRDTDKRSPLTHRMNFSPNNCLEHPITAENKSDLRNFKDAKDVKSENREAKVEVRDFYSDTRIDRQDIKSEVRSRTISIPKGDCLYAHVANMSSAPQSHTLREDFSLLDEGFGQGLQMLDQARRLFQQTRQRTKLAVERMIREDVSSQLEEARRSLDESEARRVEAERLRVEAEAGRVEAEAQRAMAEERFVKERVLWEERFKKKSNLLSRAYKMLGVGIKQSLGSSSQSSRTSK